MMLQRFVILIALIAGFGAFSAQAQNASTAPAASPAATSVGTDYIIGPEDVLQISVWKNEAISRQAPVRPDGKVSLPLLNDIQAAGLTPMQLRDKVATALSEYIPNPEVSVTVIEVRSYRVSVLGAVQKPGVLQLKSATTIMEALALAGGFKDFASPSKIVIFRKDERGATQKIRFNYNRAIGSGDEQNMMLVAGDVVVVP
jgi:polysaccharide export outer membrane protein